MPHLPSDITLHLTLFTSLQYPPLCSPRAILTSYSFSHWACSVPQRRTVAERTFLSALGGGEGGGAALILFTHILCHRGEERKSSSTPPYGDDSLTTDC